MPMQRERYPADWEAISKRIRFERAKGCCEWCGAVNGSWKVRWRDKDGPGFTFYTHAENMRDGSWHVWDEDEDGLCSEITEIIPALDGGKPAKVVLTVAHLGTPHSDGTPGDKHDKMDVRDENLAALCQACHLRYDIKEHTANAAKTRRRKRVAAGQQELGL